ncbi:hypothetical protein GX48_00948 [Paracoccidioides brasiliensis]|nr:hypothetical protein GX48_00948 [Paracoccidioides brasiliensis]
MTSTSCHAFKMNVIVDNIDEVYRLADEYAFEHVQILTQHPREAGAREDSKLRYHSEVSKPRECVRNNVLPTRKDV